MMLAPAGRGFSNRSFSSLAALSGCIVVVEGGLKLAGSAPSTSVPMRCFALSMNFEILSESAAARVKAIRHPGADEATPSRQRFGHRVHAIDRPTKRQA